MIEFAVIVFNRQMGERPPCVRAEARSSRAFPGISAGGFEFEMLLGLLLFLAFLFGGGGRYSVDHYIGKEFWSVLRASAQARETTPPSTL